MPLLTYGTDVSFLKTASFFLLLFSSQRIFFVLLPFVSVKARSQYVALPCDATGCGTARCLRPFMNTKSRPQRAASRPAAPRRKDRTEFYPTRRGAPRWPNYKLLSKGAYPLLFHWRCTCACSTYHMYIPASI